MSGLTTAYWSLLEPMTVKIQIDVSDQPTFRFLSYIEAGILASEDINQVAGRAGTNTVKTHFRKLDSSRANKLGAKRSHFYAAAAAATSFRTVRDGAVIEISHTGIAQRFFGGTITPVNSKYLTIPARTEAYGRKASDFNDLEPLIRYRNGKPRAVALVRRAQTTLGNQGGRGGSQLIGGAVYFWLVKSVTQDPDPTVLPEMRTVQTDALRAVDNYIDRQLSRIRQ